MRGRYLVLLGCLALSGCDKVSQENFARLEAGMNRGEVEQLLGKPTECSGALAFTSCTWGDQERFISVQYAADKVLMFSGRGLR
ncbi:hypothetical protein DBO85_17035 [Pseudomonas mangrovi]|uniref:Lipoprotein SmpA/OmlA domain-containing protein n=2 Tax=Pseudomonas mangrovi TaxID=2161748 RepID=A0A2T5P674_9PSED|nr:hypothetical protein [Pseudomonas mangrovi]PTU73177.1 hypothetical protein DBO85_17035 [Pseudomonas mangrovi]